MGRGGGPAACRFGSGKARESHIQRGSEPSAWSRDIADIAFNLL